MDLYVREMKDERRKRIPNTTEMEIILVMSENIEHWTIEDFETRETVNGSHM